jgi:putative phage-type endonuclease
MEIITDIEQGSEEWLSLRLGWITASRFKDVMSNGRSGAPSKTRLSYMYQLAAEALTGDRVESFSSEYMEWGTKTEPQACAMYEFDSGVSVDHPAFIKWNAVNKIGISPDGLVNDDGGIEIKCPKTTTQIETFLSGKMPSCHKPQVQGSLWVTGREWWDFVSFDPRIDGDASYMCVRQYRDEKYISELEEKCLSFEAELIEMINKLRG